MQAKVLFGYEVYRKSADAQDRNNKQAVLASGALFVVRFLE
jgi:hypothetical protein